MKNGKLEEGERSHNCPSCEMGTPEVCMGVERVATARFLLAQARLAAHERLSDLRLMRDVARANQWDEQAVVLDLAKRMLSVTEKELDPNRPPDTASRAAHNLVTALERAELQRILRGET